MTPAYSLSQAEQFERDAKLENAVLAYSGILARNPKNARASQALTSLRDRLREQREPSEDTRAELEGALAAGQHFEAAESCGALLKTFRESHFLWDFLGRCHLAAGHLDNAATCLNRALGIDPRVASTHAAMGRVHMARGQLDTAVRLYEEALTLDPACLLALRSLAEALTTQGRTTAAAAHLRNAVALAPEDASLHAELANLYLLLGQTEDAKALFDQAATLNPALTEAHYQLGLLHLEAGEPARALPCFDRILQENPAHDPARTQRLVALAAMNDWRWVAEYDSHRRLLGLRGTGCEPSALMQMEDNPDLLRIRAQAFASDQLPTLPPLSHARPEQRPERVRLGYFFVSSQGPQVLMSHGKMLAAHDAQRFEVLVFAHGGRLDEATREGFQNLGLEVHDCSGQAPAQVAEAARQQQLHIAIDLSGSATTARARLFTERLAPLHIAWPGYPGTSGTAAFDYLLGDATTCPPGSERFHSEHLLRLPVGHSAISARPAARNPETLAQRRAEHGLPETGAVFCSFANSSQITPRVFDIWMRVLAKAPDSSLWLLEANDHATSNLRRAAAKRGIDPDRLIFAADTDAAASEDRLAVADLFLDTFVVNAGTAVRAALAAGLPVLTLAGQQYAARTGASLLQAAGLGELIASDDADYESKAATLAADPDALQALRNKLLDQQALAPLFCAERQCRQVEAGFDAVFARYLNGQAADHLDIASQAASA